EAGGVLGPLYGAAFVQQWGWRWIFWANLPLTAAITLAIVLTVPRKVHRERGLRYVDIPGAVALACVLAALTIALSGSSDPLRAASPVDLRRALPFGFLACVATVCFVVRERTAGRPLLPRQLATSAVFWTAGGVNFLVGAGLIAAMVDIPLFAATVLGRPPLAAGLALLRLTASIPFAAVAGGWLAQRTGPRFVAIAGLLLTAGGFWLMSRWSLTVTDGQMTPSLILTGLGFGLVIAPVTSVAVSATGTDQRATATSLVTVLRMAGMTVGLAALTSLAFFRFQILVAGLRLPLPSAGEPTTAFDARVAAYQAGISNAALNVFTGVFLLAAVICLAACAPAWWLAEADQT
ncbi:MAG: MFS transporter, partial [Chloroflexi bacterium]|nr:MFS transporter [Chloroflexota bacterium]